MSAWDEPLTDVHGNVHAAALHDETCPHTCPCVLVREHAEAAHITVRCLEPWCSVLLIWNGGGQLVHRGDGTHTWVAA